MDKDVYYVWLAQALGTGSRAAGELLRRYSSAEQIYSLDEYPSELRISARQLRALCDKDLTSALSVIERCAKLGVKVLGYYDALFPERLRAINDPPAALYCRGNIRDLNPEYLVSVVGTRSMTEYGGKITEYFAGEFASAGAVVVSGMAAGIDAAAHRGCLAHGGYTVAILGTAIDRAYPPENEQLYYSIVNKGMVISEYAPGSEYVRNCFPKRNRLIAGISNATLVTEAGEHSGALITAKDAIMQGKEVYALPGLSGSKQSVGTNTLLQKGVRLAYRPSDVLAAAELLYPDKIRITAESYRTERSADMIPSHHAETRVSPATGVEEVHTVYSYEKIGKLEPDEVTVVMALKGSGGGLFTDEVVSASGLDAGTVMSTLTVLEVYGVVSQKNDGRYVLV